MLILVIFIAISLLFDKSLKLRPPNGFGVTVELCEGTPKRVKLYI